MSEKYELRICNNGSYYLYHKGVLINNPYITFDKFNKKDAEAIVGELNKLAEENEQLKQWHNVCRNARDNYATRIIELEKENKQLKEELEYKEKVIKQYQQSQEENLQYCESDVE